MTSLSMDVLLWLYDANNNPTLSIVSCLWPSTVLVYSKALKMILLYVDLFIKRTYF